MKPTPSEGKQVNSSDDLFEQIDHFFEGERHRKNKLRFGQESMVDVHRMLPSYRDASDSLPLQSKL